MKTKLFFAALAALAITGCMKEEGPSDPVYNTSEEAGYIGVNIRNISLATRADGAVYEDGTDAENAVNYVTFHLFDAAGNSLAVQTIAATFENSDPAADNVEEIATVVVGIDAAVVHQVPSSMVAILNAPTLLKQPATLSELKARKTTLLKNEEDLFIMTNSTYMDGSGNVMTETPVDLTHIKTTEAEAKLSPISIYVERVASKVQTTFSDALPSIAGVQIQVMKNATDPFTIDNGSGTEHEVYATIKGWEVTNNMEGSYALKKIDAVNWTDSKLGFTWNDAPFYRCYWSESAPYDPKHNKTFADLATVDPKYYHENTVPTSASDNHNAPDLDGVDNSSTANNHPVILIGAEFIDENGNHLDIVEWYGGKMLLPQFKTAILEFIKDDIRVQEGVTDPGTGIITNTTRTLTESEITFKQVSDQLADNRYLSLVTLAESAKSLTFVDIANNPLTTEQVIANIEAIEPALIWGAGGYYYFGVRHFAATSAGIGYNGMVRNHVYSASVTGITGLGTPVYDPEMVITPEKPDDSTELSYIAAEINILSWRIVAQDNIVLN